MLLLMAVLAGTNCRIATGKFAATPDFKDFKELSTQKIKGRSCRVWLLHLVPVGGFNLNDAYAEAMQSAPKEANALAHVNVNIEKPIPVIGWFMIAPIVAPWECYLIEGYPARTTGL